MKAYSWINSYTAGGQNGPIQIAHSQVGMVRDFYEHTFMKEWINDLTTVVLKGGNHKNLVEISEMLEMGYIPHFAFRESLDAANGIMTCVTCIPGEYLENAAAAYRRIGSTNVIMHDNSLYMEVRGEKYNPIDKKYRDMVRYNDWGEFSSGIERVNNCITLKKFTPWETALIELIANSRTA